MQKQAATRGGAASGQNVQYDDAAYDDYELRSGYHYGPDPGRPSQEEAGQPYDPRAYAPNPDEPYDYDKDGAPLFYGPERVEPKRSLGGLVIVGAVLAVALIGGAGAIGYKMMGSHGADGQAPLIRAETEPVKTYPESAPADQRQGKAVYDRVDQSGQKSKVVSREEEPVDLPASPSGAPHAEGSRIILPGGVASADGVQPQPAGDEPRRVKTMSIKPDTSLSFGEQRTASAAPSASDPIAEMARSGQAPKVSDFDNGIMADGPASPVAPKPAPAPRATVAPAPAPVTAARVAAAPPPSPRSAVPAPQQQAALQQPVQRPATAPSFGNPRPAAPTATTTPRSEPQQVATVAPRAAVPAATPAPATARAAPGGAFVVQVTSQRSEQDARTAYSSLQRKFPQVLGPYQPSIQTATVADRGTYYRVRVGPFGSSNDASSVCNNLRAAGGDCVVSRN